MDYHELEARTIQNYDANARVWADAHAKRYYSWAIKRLRELLPTGKILEIGCGGGQDAAELIRSGFGYLGIDASKGMIAVARANTPEGDFRHLNVYDLDKLRTLFDGFWACNVLLHIPRTRIGEALTALNRRLKPSAIGFVVMKEGVTDDFEVRDHDGRHEERLFVYWRKEDFVKILRKYGFKILEYNYTAVDSRTRQLQFFVAKEKEA